MLAACLTAETSEEGETSACAFNRNNRTFFGKWTMLWRSEWRKLRKTFEIMNAKIRQLHVAG